jgi:AcrR family transcriptional regulator
MTETRETMIRVARERFLRDGFDATSVDAIAAEAHVSPRTLFRYFPSKFELAFPFHRERVARFRALLDRCFDPDRPFAGLAEALRQMADALQQERGEQLAEARIASASRELECRALVLDEDYRTAIIAILRRAGIPPRRAGVLGGMVFGAVLHTTTEWYRDGCRTSLRRSSRVTVEEIERLDGLRG